MDWGDGSALGALLISGAALIVAVKARGDGKKSANAAERSAIAAEETLADQRREAAERRSAEEEASRPRVHLALEHVDRDVYRLMNDGNASALNIVFDEEELPYIFKLRGTGEVSLRAGEAIDFLMAGAGDAAVPPQLFAKWDGQQELVPIRVPRKR
ncbi:hypothetical protein ACIQMY_20815 [Streptomyces sp. NPDC091368]|uniref:hypothetical protein n=1 Tax=Streptomyces sp. NPDC091368 TaxID=3365993 RepID=UPI00380936F8